MALSQGQVEDVLRRAGVDTGRAQEFTGRGEFEGVGGQEQLYSELSGQGGGGGGGGGYSDNAMGLAQQILGQQRQAAQPAIQALQTESSALKTRYDTLLEGLKKTKETSLSREFGRRGISPTSGLFEQTLEEQFRPEREILTSQRDVATSSIASKIAEMQGGDYSNAYTLALNFIQQQQQAEQSAANRVLKQQEMMLKGSDVNSEVVTVGGRKILIDKRTGQIIADLGASGGGDNDPLGLL